MFSRTLERLTLAVGATAIWLVALSWTRTQGAAHATTALARGDVVPSQETLPPTRDLATLEPPLPSAFTGYATHASTMLARSEAVPSQMALPPDHGLATHVPPPPSSAFSGWRRILPAERAGGHFYGEERSLLRLFGTVPQGQTVFLALANAAVGDLAVNWAAHIYKLQLDSRAVIACLCSALLRRLLSEGIPAMDYIHRGLEADVRSSREGFRRMGALKGALVLRILTAGRSVLLSDVDVVWLRDPMPFAMATLSAHADVMVSTDCLSITADEEASPRRRGVNRCAYRPGNGEGHAAFNTGILAFGVTPSALAAAAAWLALLNTSDSSGLPPGHPSLDRNLDDQFALNSILWRGFRNHHDGTVLAARPNGEQRPNGPYASSGERLIRVEAERSGDGGGASPAALPGWLEGWALLPGRGARPTGFVLAPLPTRLFCAGHLYWQQQHAEPHECLAVHTTFTESGVAGKVWRLREGALWLLDPPTYWAAPSQGFLTFTPPQPKLPLPPERNESAPAAFSDRSGSGWIPQDALRLFPRLAAHLELVRRHRLALRDALALALALNRTLVLPRLLCLCDRAEGPSLVLPQCSMGGSDERLPFLCPLTHIFDLPRLLSLAGEPGGVALREHSFLRNPLAPPDLRATRTVAVVQSSAVAEALRATGRVALHTGTTDREARMALADVKAPVLHLETAEGIFGGWANERSRERFEGLAQRHFYGGSWCCSSWDPPTYGSIQYADPMPTRAVIV